MLLFSSNGMKRYILFARRRSIMSFILNRSDNSSFLHLDN